MNDVVDVVILVGVAFRLEYVLIGFKFFFYFLDSFIIIF